MMHRSPLPYNVEDINKRLASTVVMYDDAPVYIIGAAAYGRADATVSYHTLPFVGRPLAINTLASSKVWNIYDLRLGYINDLVNVNKLEAGYTTRVPMREVKQGLNANNFKLDAVYAADFAKIIAMQGFVNMLKGNYPPFPVALEMVKSKGGRAPNKFSSVAFNRNFAIGRDDLENYILWYKGQKVASTQDMEVGFKMPRRYQYLTEVVQDVTGLRVRNDAAA